ncbi:MAG: phage tail protein [Actinomycetota bacterium]
MMTHVGEGSGDDPIVLPAAAAGDAASAWYGAHGPDWMLDELPGVLAGDPFLQRFLRIFQDVADTVRWPTDHLDHYVRPDITPLTVLQWWSEGLGVAVDSAWPERRQREYVQQAAPLVHQRGTIEALRQQIEALTRGRVEIKESGGVRVRRRPRTVEGRSTAEPDPLEIRVESFGGFEPSELHAAVRALVPAHCVFVIKPFESDGTGPEEGTPA